MTWRSCSASPTCRRSFRVGSSSTRRRTGSFHDVSSARFHDWVMDQIYGVHSYVYPSAARDPSSGQLNAPYTGMDTWTPCDPGVGFTWSASYDFGGDASGSISTDLGKTPL